jgi:CubicO group peptidase (beta-lactamase class C family)
MMPRSFPGDSSRPRLRQRVASSLGVLLLLGVLPNAEAQRDRVDARYAPERWEWQTKRPDEVGMDAAKIQEAVRWANAHESTAPSGEMRDAIARGIAGEPFNDIIGPAKDRAGVNGVIVRHGYIVAEWGDTLRADMTFSATKSYLSTVAGLALDRGLIRSVDDPVKSYVDDGTFDSPHNSKVTWRHLLNQTSEWEGTLWGKPDWADRFKGQKRPYVDPGTAWTYNDVRVNLLAYSLLQVWRRPLPQVLKEEIMDPIGASNTWRWHGYRNSLVQIDGIEMQSVSGGGHWGGGLFIGSRDQARFGLLYLRRGVWRGRRLLSENWIKDATTPVSVQPAYGYLVWLNTDRQRYPSAPATSVFVLGAGTNIIWIDPDHDLVAVVRWIEDKHVDTFMKLVLESVTRILDLNGARATP